ncbi:MAG: helix-turn-helix domain-containing protein [Candidatus Heimdallarchaeota archaeon]
MDRNKSSLARVKIKFPDQLWISEVFREFPDLKMEIAHFLPYDLERSIGNSIVELMHYQIQDIVEVIRNHPSVFEFSILEQEENKIKINVKTKDPFLLYAIIKCGVLVDFPVRVEEGYAFWRLISSRKRIDQLLSIFEQKQVNFELLRIGISPYKIEDDRNKLSFDELNILDKAVSLGFFEIPRKISLEELANQLGKSKSALSVMLRKIIKKKVLFKK